MSARLTGLALVTLASIPLAAQEQKSIKGERVAIYNLAGRMRAVAGTGDAVVVEINRGGSERDKLKIETGPIRGRETLRVIYPSDRIVYPDIRGSRSSVSVHSDGTFSDGTSDDWRRDRVDIRGYGPGAEAFADLVVHVPKGQKVELFLAVGRAEISNVEGDLLLDVGAAEVDIAGLKGALTLDTGSGRVVVRDVTGDIDIDTGSGGLTLDRVKGDMLRLDSGSGGVQATDVDVKEIKADVGSGGLRLYRLKAAQVGVESGSGGATIELLSDVDRLDVETGSGGVTIRAPGTLGAEVEAETGSGGFQTDFEITTRRLGRNHFAGTIGSGKGRIRIESGSGSVRLLKN